MINFILGRLRFWQGYPVNIKYQLAKIKWILRWWFLLLASSYVILNARFAVEVVGGARDMI